MLGILLVLLVVAFILYSYAWVLHKALGRWPPEDDR